MIFTAGILCLIAFSVHAIAGDREFAQMPVTRNSTKTSDTWVQTRSGWHWVSTDLLLSGILLLLIETTQVISARTEILNLASIYFYCCGTAWLITVLISKDTVVQIWRVGQWMFCFLMSLLIYLGH